jgi:hypothetical protein
MTREARPGAKVSQYLSPFGCGTVSRLSADHATPANFESARPGKDASPQIAAKTPLAT